MTLLVTCLIARMLGQDMGISIFLGFLVSLSSTAMVLSGLALSQIGEFSFILSKSGVEHGLLSANAYQIFLAVSVLSMAATPFIMAKGASMAALLMSLPLPKRLPTGLKPQAEGACDEGKEIPKDHILIVGYGLNGRNVARAARNAGIPYMIVEMNPVTVKKEKAKGEHIYYGDGSQEAVLEHVGVHEARIMVIAIPDLVATRMIVASARSLNPRLHIITRTRFLQEIEALYEAGKRVPRVGTNL